MEYTNHCTQINTEWENLARFKLSEVTQEEIKNLNSL